MREVLPTRDIRLSFRPHLGHGLLDRPGLQRFGRAARPLDLLEQRPGAHAELIGERFDGAGPRRRIGDALEVRFLDQNGLRVAGDAARKRVREPKRSAERKHRYRVGAADGGGKCGDGPTHDVPVGVAPRHHAPGGLGGDDGARRLEPAGLLDARPKFSDRPELGDGEELILVRGEAKEDVAARIVELDAARFQRA